MPDLREEFEAWKRTQVDQDAWSAVLWATERAAKKEWRPIETAPRDATAILVMQNNWPGCPNGVAQECNGHNTYVAEWWAGERKGDGAWICYMDAIRDPECPIEPTHWMPLPEPPDAAAIRAREGKGGAG